MDICCHVHFLPGLVLTQSSSALCRGDSMTGSFSLTGSDGVEGVGDASAPPLPLATAPPPELDLFVERGKGTGTPPVTDTAARALVDLVTLGAVPLVGGGGSFADVDLFRPPLELVQPYLRDEDELEVGVAVAEAKGVVGRETEPRELGPAVAPLASALTLRYCME